MNEFFNTLLPRYAWIDLVLVAVFSYAGLHGFLRGVIPELVYISVSYLLVPLTYVFLYSHNPSWQDNMNNYSWLFYIATSVFASYTMSTFIQVLQIVLGVRLWTFLNDPWLGALLSIGNMACYLSCLGHFISQNTHNAFCHEMSTYLAKSAIYPHYIAPIFPLLLKQLNHYFDLSTLL